MIGLEANLLAQAILFIFGIIGIIAYPPQIIQLYKTKESDDVNVLTWLVWALTYVVFAIYVFIYTTDIVLVILYLIELGLCLWIALLAIKYKSKRTRKN